MAGCQYRQTSIIPPITEGCSVIVFCEWPMPLITWHYWQTDILNIDRLWSWLTELLWSRDACVVLSRGVTVHEVKTKSRYPSSSDVGILPSVTTTSDDTSWMMTAWQQQLAMLLYTVQLTRIWAAALHLLVINVAGSLTPVTTLSDGDY